MTDDNNSNSFSYTYSAKQQEEVRRIREKYQPSEKSEDKLEQLRRLDRRVSDMGTLVSLILGVLGLLLLGIGMSLIMTDLGNGMGDFRIPFGVILGVLGIISMCLSYPMYILVTKKERERVAPEVIRLSDELMK